MDLQQHQRKRQSPPSINDNDEYDTSCTNLRRRHHAIQTKNRKLIPIPSSFEHYMHHPTSFGHETGTVLVPLPPANQNTEGTVEDRVRARSLLFQQSSGGGNHSLKSGNDNTTSSVTTTTTGSTSTLDPQFIIHVTDALWSYLITTNFRQQQIMQQKHRRRQSSSPNESSDIVDGNKAATKSLVTKTTQKKIIMMHHTQNLILKEVVNELRRTMQANTFGKSITGGKTNITQCIQGSSFTGTNSSSNSVSRREIVNVLVEIHTNSTIYQHWITLLNPNTMQNIISCSNDDIPPNTIVQIDHSIAYQSIRKHLLLLL